MGVRSLRFWQHEEDPPPPAPAVQPPGARFGLTPRADIGSTTATADPALAAKRERLRQRREIVLFDVERSEAATQPDNPWRARVAVIDEAIEAIEHDREAALATKDSPGRSFPATPITGIQVELSPARQVHFQIAHQAFAFAEPLDWAERGFQLTKSDLEPTTGNAAALVPNDWPAAEHEAAARHLAQSLFVFATDLVTHAQEEQPLPALVTLAEIAAPDPHGGWLDWLGHSASDARRVSTLQALESETLRLLAERDRELAEEAKWADRLPIARKRLAAVDAEIAALEEGS